MSPISSVLVASRRPKTGPWIRYLTAPASITANGALNLRRDGTRRRARIDKTMTARQRSGRNSQALVEKIPLHRNGGARGHRASSRPRGASRVRAVLSISSPKSQWWKINPVPRRFNYQQTKKGQGGKLTTRLLFLRSPASSSQVLRPLSIPHAPNTSDCHPEPGVFCG